METFNNLSYYEKYNFITMNKLVFINPESNYDLFILEDIEDINNNNEMVASLVSRLFGEDIRFNLENLVHIKGNIFHIIDDKFGFKFELQAMVMDEPYMI